MNDLVKWDEVDKQIDDLLIEEENIIRQTGVQGAWIIGEQLAIAKQKVIETTGDGRAPGFVDWMKRKFGWTKMTSSRLIKAYEDHEEDIKKIWGNQKSVTLTLPNLPIPTGKYRVIYADPPWKYTEDGLTGVSNKDEYGNVEKHYPQLSTEELCELVIPETEDNAVLFLWATSPFLEKSFQVINAWGFQYKAGFVWDKVKHNFGYYNSVRHELLLICTKGSCRPDSAELIDSVQSIERTKHSEKPEELRNIIDKLYPGGKRIELFARKNVDGWDTWGNEIE